MAISLLFEERIDGTTANLTDAGGAVTREYICQYVVDGVKGIKTGQNVVPEEAAIQFNDQVFAIGSQHPIFTDPFIYLVDIRAEVYEATMAKVFARWEPREVDVAGNSHGEIWRFQLGTQETLITSVSEESLQQHFPEGVKHDVGQGINEDDQGTVNGVMVKRPAMTISVSKKIPNSNFNVQWNVVHDRLNTVNSAPWWNYKAREVLFLGSDIPQRTARDEWTFTYNFEAARQQTSRVWEFFESRDSGTKVVTTATEEISIDPWSYVGFRWFKIETEDGDGNKTYKRYIRDLHIAKVYEESVFDAFNLNDPDD